MAEKKELKKELDKMENEELELMEDQEETERDMIVKFHHPYLFEGKEYSEIDLSGAEEMNAEDMIRIERRIARKTGNNVVPKNSVEYTVEFAAVAAKMPVEFFKGLDPKNIVRLQNVVTVFLYI